MKNPDRKKERALKLVRPDAPPGRDLEGMIQSLFPEGALITHSQMARFVELVAEIEANMAGPTEERVMELDELPPPDRAPGRSTRGRGPTR